MATRTKKTQSAYGLVQNCSNSIALTMELQQSCIKRNALTAVLHYAIDILWMYRSRAMSLIVYF